MLWCSKFFSLYAAVKRSLDALYEDISLTVVHDVNTNPSISDFLLIRSKDNKKQKTKKHTAINYLVALHKDLSLMVMRDSITINLNLH